MVRRALHKAVAIPGYRIPFGSREYNLPPSSICQACDKLRS